VAMVSDLGPCLSGIFVLTMMIQPALLWRGHVQCWWPRIRRKSGLPPAATREVYAAWQWLFVALGLVCGILIWKSITHSWHMQPIVDYLGRLISMGLGEVILLAIIDGWFLWRDLRR